MIKSFNYVWNYTNATIAAFKARLFGYRTYKAFLTQSGTNPPVANVVENGLGFSVEFDYIDPGFYICYLINSNVFSSPTTGVNGEKVEVTITPSSSLQLGPNSVYFMAAGPIFNDAVGIFSGSIDTGANNLLGFFQAAVLEIRIYNR